MKKLDFDLAFDLKSDFSFESDFMELLAELGKKFPEVFVRIIELRGPAGGWPHVEVVAPEERLAEFAEWYCGDASDVEDYMGEAVDC